MLGLCVEGLGSRRPELSTSDDLVGGNSPLPSIGVVAGPGRSPSGCTVGDEASFSTSGAMGSSGVTTFLGGGGFLMEALS